MKINAISANNYVNLNQKFNFKGELIIDKNIYDLCELDQNFINKWKKKLPSNSSVKFDYIGDNDTYSKSYVYKAFSGNIPVYEHCYALSTYGIKTWDTYNTSSWEAKMVNRENLNKCLEDCFQILTSIKKK